MSARPWAVCRRVSAGGGDGNRALALSMIDYMGLTVKHSDSTNTGGSSYLYTSRMQLKPLLPTSATSH